MKNKTKRKYVRKCPVCSGNKEFDLIQIFRNEEYITPVKCRYCDENGNIYDNRKSVGKPYKPKEG